MEPGVAMRRLLGVREDDELWRVYSDVATAQGLADLGRPTQGVPFVAKGHVRTESQEPKEGRRAVAPRVADGVNLEELCEMDEPIAAALRNDSDRECAALIVSSERAEPSRAEIGREELRPAGAIGLLEEVSQGALRICSRVGVLQVVRARNAERVPAAFAIRA